MDAKTEPQYICIHEEQLQNHSRKIERMDAELNYKKEKLDEIKLQKRKIG